MRKITHILGNGCSYVKNGWTYGQDKVNFRETDTFSQEPNSFPRMVGENLGITADNIATAGTGIQFAIYSTMLWIENNRDKVKNTLLLFGLTAFQRATFFTKAKYPDKFRFDGIPDKMPNHLTPNVHIPDPDNDKKTKEYWEARGFDPYELRDFFTFYYKDAHHGEHWNKWIRMQLEMFQSYLIGIDMPHLFIDTLAYEEDLSYLHSLFRFPDGYTCWKAYIKSYDPIYEEEHPNIHDHLVLSKHIAKYCRNNYNI